jgi:hypothetical protein
MMHKTTTMTMPILLLQQDASLLDPLHLVLQMDLMPFVTTTSIRVKRNKTMMMKKKKIRIDLVHENNESPSHHSNMSHGVAAPGTMFSAVTVSFIGVISALSNNTIVSMKTGRIGTNFN